MSRKKLVLTAIVLILILAIGGILAYFTDVETKTNTFQMGNIDIIVEEPSWPGNDEVVNIIPNQEVPKDPQITNNGTNDVYAFVKVVVPYENVTLEGQSAKTEQELFTYTVNEGWVEVGAAEKNTTDKTVTHVYAYAEGSEVKALLKNETTPAVFDKIKFVNMKETEFTNSAVQSQELNVVVSGYGIQTTDLGTESKVPADIWSLLQAQN